MSNFTLRAIKAKHGDSLLLSSEDATVLIDGGPSGVYKQALREQLLQLKGDSDNAPHIDLLMVSHIDADHIDGILDLTAELIEARDEEREPIVSVEHAWHNSFSDIIAKAGVKMPKEVQTSAASIASAFNKLTGLGFNPHESKLVLSSVAQGRRLRDDLEVLNINQNKHFNDRVVLQDNTDEPWVCGDMKLTVIGPTQDELDKLRKEWATQLKKILSAESEAATAAANKLDTSVSNLASIVAIAEVGNKSILLTGDARGDMILKWLENTDGLKPSEACHFNIVKLPHHGSDRNVNPEFFTRVTADHYIISGNGGHGNPEPNTLEMLFNARPDLNYKIHMTYSPEELKTSNKFQDEGNVPKLEATLSDPLRLATLRFSRPDQMYVDIEL